jgi:hypothetical protein
VAQAHEAGGDAALWGILIWAQAAVAGANDGTEIDGDAPDVGHVFEYEPPGTGVVVRARPMALEALQDQVIELLGGQDFTPKETLPPAYRAAEDATAALGGEGATLSEVCELVTRRVLLAGLRRLCSILDTGSPANANHLIAHYLEAALEELSFDRSGRERATDQDDSENAGDGDTLAADCCEKAIGRLADEGYLIAHLYRIAVAIDRSLRDHAECAVDEDEDECPICFVPMELGSGGDAAQMGMLTADEERACIPTLCRTCTRDPLVEHFRVCPTCSAEFHHLGQGLRREKKKKKKKEKKKTKKKKKKKKKRERLLA